MLYENFHHPTDPNRVNRTNSLYINTYDQTNMFTHIFDYPNSFHHQSRIIVQIEYITVNGVNIGYTHSDSANTSPKP